MATYYFHTSIDGENGPVVPRELGTLQDVQVELSRYAGDLLKDFGDRIFHENLGVQVVDEYGLVLYSILMVATVAAAVSPH